MSRLYASIDLQADKDSNLNGKPNFHMGCHWQWFIKEYGMPKWWDSERHENKHQDAIADRKMTSGQSDLYLQLTELEQQYV